MTAAFNRPVVCPVLVGRAPALAALERLAERARDGRSQTALIAGEAGIGKSRLVAEIKARARQRGMAILEGHCFEPDRALPYAPLFDLLRALPAGPPAGDLARDLGPAAHDLARLFPELAALAPVPTDGQPPPAPRSGRCCARSLPSRERSPPTCCASSTR